MKDLDIETNDLFAISGLVIVTIGAAMVYLPAGFLVLGGLLLVYAIAASRKETPK